MSSLASEAPKKGIFGRTIGVISKRLVIRFHKFSILTILSTGKHFTYRSLEDEDVLFVKAHKTACDLLSEARPNYGDRRLGSQVCNVIFSKIFIL